MSDTDPNAPAEDNPFAPFAEGAPTQEDKSFGALASDALKAGFYGTIAGKIEAAHQANPTPLGPETFGLDPRAGLTPDEEDYLAKERAKQAIEQARLAQSNERAIPVTSAQLAQLRYELDPAATSGLKAAAAYGLGGLVGAGLSPESLIFPETGAAAGLARMGAGKFLQGVGGTAASMAVAQTVANPLTQALAIQTGDQTDFSPGSFALAPFEGALGGAVFHTGLAGIGVGAKAVGNVVGRFAEGFSARAEHPAFRPIGEPARAPAPEAPAAPEPPLETTHSTADTAILVGERPTGGAVEYQVQKVGEEFAVTRTEHGPDGEPVENRSGTLDAKGESVETGPMAAGETEPPAPVTFPTKEAAVEFAQKQEGRVEPTAEATAKVEAPAPVEPVAAPEVQAAQQAAETIRSNREPLPEFKPEASAATPEIPDRPAGVFMFDAASLKTDAKRFQYKDNGDAEGVTTALKSVTKWDAAKANQIIVWEAKDGSLYVADGHQRSGLARRLITQGNEEKISLPGILYREADGFSPEDIRAIAAAKNIAEGSGSPIDGAKVLRSRPDLMDGSMPVSRTEARQAFDLARLDDESFRMVVNEVVPYQQAAVVGRIIPTDGARQQAALKAIARFEPRNETEATILVQRVAQSELDKASEGAQGSMFGDMMGAESTAGEEMRIVAKAIAELRQDKTLLSRVVANADRIEATGSRIERQGARAVAEDAETFSKVITSNAYSAGPIRSALLEGAREVKSGTKTVNEAARDILNAVRAEVEADVRARAGNRGGGERAPAVEPGAEGKPQTLIPGVEPVTDKQRLDLAGAKPLTGGDAAPGGMFDTDARAQTDLLAGLSAEDKASMLQGLAQKAQQGQEDTPFRLQVKIKELEYKIEKGGYRKDLLQPQLDAARAKLAAMEAAKPQRRPRRGAGDEASASAQETVFRKKGVDQSKAEFKPVDTNSPEFKAWFGKSQIVGADGKPLTVYHGTNSDITAFDPKMSAIHKVRGKGAIFFTTSPDVASSYPKFAWARDEAGNAIRRYEEGGNVIPVHLKMENPAVWDMGGANYSESVVSRAIREAKRDGHDGVVFTNMRDEPAYGGGAMRKSHIIAAFEGTQIKSAISNTGAFDPKNANIQFRKRTGPASQTPGSSGAASAEHGPITSLQQQSFALSEAIGVPLRQGRLKGGKDTLGQYSRSYGVARVRQVGDFYTVAHEGGHALEQQMPELSSAIRQARAELGPLDYDPTRGDPSEGFSEFFATALTNPAAAQMQAPTFYPEFRRLLGDKNPELLAKLDEASAGYRAYLAAPSGARIQAQIVDGERHGWIRETVRRLKESDDLPHTIGLVLGEAYTALISANHPLSRTVRDLTRAIQQEQGGGLVSIEPSRDPNKLMALFGNVKNGALTQLRDGIVPYREVKASGASLRDAINHAAGGPRFLGLMNEEATADLSTYMVAKRASVLWDREAAGLLDRPPVGFSKADAEQAMADLLAKNPRLDQAAMMAHEYTRNLLTKQRDAGIIKQDLFDKLMADPFYTPLFRDVTDKPLASGGAGGGSSDGPGMVDTVKKLRGSSRDIIDPLQGLMMQTFLAERTIRHNDIIRGLAQLAERAGYRGKGVVEPVSAKELSGTPFDLGEQIKNVARQRGLDEGDTQLLMQSVTNAFGDDPIMGTMFKMDVASKRGEPILFYKEAGDLRAIRLSAKEEGMALYETMSSLPAVATDAWIKMMTASTKALRFGVVIHPTYVLTNYIKDQVALGILRSDYLPILSGGPGLWAEMTQKDAAKMYAYFGGMSAGTATTGIAEAAKNQVSQITKSGYLSTHLTSFDGLSELTQITEAATRNSIFAKVYEQKIKQGLAPVDAAVEAAYQGTDIMDFGRHGSKTLALRAYAPFINAHFVGLDKAIRTMVVPLARLAKGDILTADERAAAANAGWAVAKLAALTPVLGAMLAAFNSDSEEYRDATPEQKAQNFIFAIGGKLYRIPKPYELGLGFTAGEHAYAAMAQKDPRAAMAFLEGAWDVLKPPNPLTANPLVKTVVESQTGVSLFTGRDIVPPKLKEQDPQYQYNEKTSPFARKVSDWSAVVSNTLNNLTGSDTKAWSPMLVDNVIGNTFGNLGKEIQNQSKAIFGDNDRPEGRFEDAAFIKRFTLDPAKWSATVQRYYEFAAAKTGEYAQAANTFQTLFERPSTRDQAMEWMRTLSDDKKAFAILQVGGGEDGKGAFKPEDRKLHPVSRAQLALTQLHSLSREILNNNQTNTDDGSVIQLTPAQRRDAKDKIDQLGALEMRNALVIVGDKGYAGRPVLSLQDQFDVLKAVSPEIAAEVARRYATAKIPKTDYIAQAWPEVRSELLKNGTDADLSEYRGFGVTDGYEFDGARTKRRLKPRAQIRLNEPAPAN